MITSSDMVIEDLAAEVAEIEESLVEAVAEGDSYRSLLRVALALYAEERERNQRLERRCKATDQRMREFLGDEEMHPEQSATSSGT